MGIKQRRERQRQDLKDGILTAARDIAVQDGWQEVTIRKIAERIEYSPPMIYEYFKNKEAIFNALFREGFRLLLIDLQLSRAAAPTADDALVTTALAYWQFAWRHPELYQLMHGLGGVPFSMQDEAVEAKEVFATTEDLLQNIARRPVSQAELDDAVHVVWATLHGMVALAMAGHFPHSVNADPITLLNEGQHNAVRLVQVAMRQFLIAWQQPS